MDQEKSSKLEKQQAALIKKQSATLDANAKRLTKAVLFHSALFDHLQKHGSISLEKAASLSALVQKGRYTSPVMIRRSRPE